MEAHGDRIGAKCPAHAGVGRLRRVIRGEDMGLARRIFHQGPMDAGRCPGNAIRPGTEEGGADQNRSGADINVHRSISTEIASSGDCKCMGNCPHPHEPVGLTTSGARSLQIRGSTGLRTSGLILWQRPPAAPTRCPGPTAPGRWPPAQPWHAIRPAMTVRSWRRATG